MKSITKNYLRYILLIISLFLNVLSFATDYYSNSGGNFTTTTIWGINTDGSGAHPSGLSDFQDGTNTFTILDNDAVIINDSINCAEITVGEGTSGTLTFGNDATARWLIVQGTFTVNTGATVNVGAYNATHNMQIEGDLTNNGTIDLRNNSSQNVNTTLNGTFSITGNTPTFNNLTISGGTITANVALDIDATLTIENGATFAAGTLTHTVAGNWTENGNGAMTASGAGTINMDASLVQSITTTATFNHLTFSNGGIVSIGDNITVNGDLEISGNTKVTTSSNHYVYGDFTVNAGSKYEATDGYLYFYGSSAQTITVTDDCEFDRVYFRYGSPNLKTIVGNITFDDYSYVYADADITGTGTITYKNGLNLLGSCSFSGTINFNGGTFRDDGDGAFSMGTANIIVEGYPYIQTNDTMTMDGNLTINSGYLVINNGAYLIGTGNDNTLTVKDNTTLYLRGSDNFPTGFGTYTFEELSTARYDANMAQTVRGGITYGRLFLRYNTKTVDGALDINDYLYLQSTCTLDLGSYDHTIESHIYNNGGDNSITTSGGTVTLDGADENQYIYAGSSLVFNNLVITNSAPTAVRVKRIYGNITLNGDITVTNTGGNEAKYLQLEIFDSEFTDGGGSGNFSVGSHVKVYTNGTDNFETITTEFTTSLNTESTVVFNGTNQNLPSLTYGNIELYGNGNKTAQGSLDINGDVIRIGYTPVLVDNGNSITVAGDWELAQAYTNLTGETTFDGADQTISASNFGNLVFGGTETKYIDGTLDVIGNVTINNGITVNADNRYIYLGGNWINSGTGEFTQENGRTTFDGDNIDQSILVNASNTFGDIYINKTGATKTLTANSDITVLRNFIFTQNNGDFDLNGNTLYIGGDWYIYTGCTFTHNNGKLVFNGSSEDQLIRNYNATTEYYDIEFKNSGIKRLYQNNFDINGDVNINSSTLYSYGYTLNIAGDWTNSGTFISNGKVVFDGAAQTIGSSTFHDVEISGTSVKTLAGNISCSGWLQINEQDTLDVSTNNYNITIEEHWYNNEGDGSGYFEPREGTVTFNGGYTNIETGGITAGKQFYNLTINNSSSYTRLYPTTNNNLKVLNNLTLNSETSSPFYTYYNDVYIGGSLTNNGAYYYQNSNTTPNKIVFDGTSGTHDINFGNLYVLQDTIVIDSGANYKLTGDLSFNQGGNLRISDGKLDLNSHVLEMLTGNVIIESNGTLEVDSAAVLKVERHNSFLNQGGVFKLIGNQGAPATLTSRRDNFEYTQTGASAEFHAQYYLISNTEGNGIDIQEGIIDGTNNLSYGTFTGGTGTAYLTTNDINLGAGITATKAAFNNGPTYNVQRTTGSTGILTFANATGTFSGESYEDDSGNLIDWTFPSRITWDGGAATNKWNDADNWNPNGVPTSADNVYLDNSSVAGAYTVEIETTDAVADRVDIAGSSAITLSINGAELQVLDNLTIYTGNILEQVNATDTLHVRGDFSNEGSYDPQGVGVFHFNPTGGFQTLNSTSSFYDLIIDCDTITTAVVLGQNIDVDNDLSIINGTLSASNRNITVGGNWLVEGGYFDAGTGSVTFDKSTGNQTIGGGVFYDLYTSNGATKEVTKNIDVNRYFSINSGSKVNGGEQFIYIGGRFNNYAGKNGFTQNGSGTVIFNGTGNCYLQNAAHDSTIFNNLTFQGNGTKFVYDTIIVNGDLINQQGSNTYLFEDSYLKGEGANNSFNMTGGTLYVRGENNFPQDFENISITAGYVDYYSDTDQYIYPTTYYNLRLRSIHPNDDANRNTKTATSDFTVTNYCVVYDSLTTFDMNNHTLTIGGGLDFRFEQTPQIAWGTGSVNFNGGNVGIDPYIHFFNNVTKSGSGSLTLYDTIQVNGDMIMESDTRLNMQTYKITCDSVGKTFTLEDGVILYTYVLSDDDPVYDNPGMPTGFDSYSLDPTSTVYYRGVGKQTIYTHAGLIDYGNLYIYTNTTDTLSLDGNLDVNGNFRMYYNNPVLIDSGYNMNLAGTTIDLRKYYPTNTITFDGTTQTIYNGQGNDTLKLNNVILAGSTGQKTFYEPVTRTTGDITIGANDTMYIVYDLEHSGTNFTNNGYFRHVRNTVKFNGGAQTIDPGAENDFYGVLFTNGNTKTITNHGLDIYNGTFRIEDTTEVDLGTLTHTIASTNIEFEDVTVDSLHATNATIDFDRAGTQYIPKIHANALEFSNGGWKILTDTIWVNDFTINAGAYFRPGDVSPDAFPMYINGNWTNNGYFRSHEGVVHFESNTTSAKTITSGGYSFYKVKFNQDSTSTRKYTLADDAIFTDSLIIGNGATLDLNGHALQLGNNDTGTPPGEGHIIQNGGTLEVDAGASLLFDCYDDTASFVVESGGTLSVIGASGNHANVTRATNRYAYNLTIESGATIKAKYYHFQYLADSGLYVMDGAIIDPANNFSYGMWSNIYTGTNHGVQRYLYIDTDVSGIGNITDITFNHGGTPTQGVHYNVKRGPNAVGTITFDGTISGLIGGETYEDEGSGSSVSGGNIEWPPVTTLTWTGTTNTDWFTASNWSPQQVPDITNDVIVPIVTNNPIINTTDTAKCESLNVTDGILVLDAGILNLNTDLTLGSGAIFGVGDPSASIIVGRDWNSATDANFVHGDDTVKFKSTTTTAFITPRNTTFKNVVFDGTSTFFLDGNTFDIDGEFKILNGTVYPNNNGYALSIAGNYNNVGGTFSTDTRGVVDFDGADQSITNGTFSQLKISGTGTKTTSGSLKCDYYNSNFNYKALEINSTLTAGAAIDVDGNVYINSDGTFNDGGFTHTFAGYIWESDGTYSGTGTVTFDGGTQYLRNSNFNNLQLNNQSDEANNWKYLVGDVDLTGDLTINCYALQCYDYQITNTDGSGTFTMTEMDNPYNRIYLRGTNNYPTGFSAYVSDKMSYQIYDGTEDQIIKGKSGGSDPVVEYGYLYLNSATTKTLGGDIDVNGRLYFYNQDVTLDASTNNYKINLAGNWYNQYTGSFICRQGEVIMDGSLSWPGNNQWIYLGTSGTNDFYKLTINSTCDYMRIYNTNITVNSNLSVIEGNLYLYNGFTTTVKGDFSASGNGKFYQTGTYKLAKSTGTANIQMNGSTLNNLTIDAGATYTLLDDLALNGTFNLDAGTFNGNGNNVSIGNYIDVANISGTYKVGAGGSLKLSNGSSFNVLNGGVFELIGSEGDAANVTNQSGNSRYNFSVESGATIKAENYLFEYMSNGGIFLKDGSIIDNTYHFSNGTFTNPTSGGTCLHVENNQTFTNGDRIENVVFDLNPGNGTYNVTKTSNTIGTLEFYNATGSLSGEYYDNDPGSNINWTGPVTLTWTGTIDDNWFDKRNWDPNIGAQKVPTSTDDVIIAQSLNPPKIEQDSAIAKNLTIENGAFLTINTPAGDNDTALIVNGNLTNEGTFTMTTTYDTIIVKGNWEKQTAAIFNPGSGTVVLKVESGIKSLINGDASFNNLVVDAIGTLEINSDTYIDNDFNILSGTLDVTSNNYDLYIGGSFTNSGTFIANNGKITFNSSSAGTETLNTGASELYNVEINADASTTYQLNSNITINDDLDILEGTLDLNNRILNFGDGTDTDVLSVENNGILNIDANACLKLGENASILIKSGGKFKAIGTDEDNVATVTSQDGTNYSFEIYSGGELQANYYEIAYVDATGLWFKSGATLNSTYPLSNGTFSNGVSGGRYLLFENTLTVGVNDTIKNVVFNSGASVNAKRTSGSNPIIFSDAFGLRGSYYYEEDDEGTPAAHTGLVRWYYTDPTLTWTGNDFANNVNWDNPLNWDDGAAGNGVPNYQTNVFIPDVEHDPVLNSGTDDSVKNVTIYSGGHLTIGGNMDLYIQSNLSGEGSLNVSDGSLTTIEVGDNWDNLGTFTNGGSSTVKFIKSSGNIDINPGGNAFYNLTFNSGGDGSGSATFRTAASFNIDGDLDIATNTTFEVTSSSHTLNISGDYTNNGTFTNGGTTVTFDGAGAQSINSAGTDQFTNLTFAGSGGTKTINCDIIIDGDLTIAASNTLDGNSSTISLKGDWIDNGTFTPTTSNVKFTGSSLQNITKSTTESFYDLTIDNSASNTAVQLSTAVNVSNKLYLTHGILETSHSSILNMLAGSSVNDGTAANAGSATSYINGPMTKDGDTDFTFPVGKASVFARFGVANFAGSSSLFKIEYFDIAPSNRSNLTEPLNNISSVEKWTLSRISGSAEPVVTVYWEDDAYSSTEKEADVVVAQYDGSSWVSLQGKPATDNGDGTGYCTADNSISIFNDLTIGFEYPTATWQGDVSADWNTKGNWDLDTIPTSKMNIIIPAVATDPIIGNTAYTYNLTIQNGALLTINGGNDLDISGIITIDAGGTLTVADGSSSEITINKEWVYNGTFNPGNGSTVIYNKNGDQNIELSVFNNLTIAGSGTKTLTTNIDIDNDLNISSTLSAGNYSINIGGDWTNTGTFNRGSGTVEFDGAAQQTITKSGVGESFYDLKINNSSATSPQIVLGGKVTIESSLFFNDGNIQSTSSNLLVMGAGANISQYTDSTYVIGPMQKYGTNAFVFPLGKESRYARLGLSGLTGNGIFTAEYFDSPGSDLENRAAELVKIDNKQHWDVSRINNYTAKVTLYYEDSAYSKVKDPADILIAHYYGGQWISEGNTAYSPADKTGWVTSGVFSGFSPITFGSSTTNNPLPIELTNFSAKVNNENIELSWTTLSEKNNSHFIIQRSIDMVNYDNIAWVNGAGNSTQALTYSYIDEQPIIGTAYYRLLQVDFDGTFTLYDWTSVYYSNPEAMDEPFDVKIYPNPGNQNDMTVKVTVKEIGTVDFEIFNVTGNKLYAGKVLINNNNEQYQLDLSTIQRLKSGIYLLNVIGKNKKEQIRFVIF